MTGRYEVSGKSGDSRFRIKANDDDAIASSEGSTTRVGAPGGIGSVKRNADSRFVGLMEKTWNGEVMMGEIATADGKNSLRFSEGIIESIWRPGSVVDVEDARASILAVERLSGGMPGPLLVEMTDVQVSAAARHAYDEARSVAAVARRVQRRRPGRGSGHGPAHLLPTRVFHLEARRRRLAKEDHRWSRPAKRRRLR